MDGCPLSPTFYFCNAVMLEHYEATKYNESIGGANAGLPGAIAFGGAGSRLEGALVYMQLKKLNDKSIDQLFEAILTLRDVEEAYVFFDDLCTVNEIQSLSQRLEVARMLGKGQTYNQIETETGASTATISRVKRCLNYGNDGYKLTLERLGRFGNEGQTAESATKE